jgi:hypothetical protein
MALASINASMTDKPVLPMAWINHTSAQAYASLTRRPRRWMGVGGTVARAPQPG